MNRYAKRALLTSLAALLLAGTVPASGFPATYKNDKFDAIGTGDKRAWLWDGSADSVPVRAHHYTTNGSAYDISNNSGFGHAVTEPVRRYRINATYICRDYPIGDCSGLLG